MKVHEYQGKEIFRKYKIPTPNGIPVFSVEEALKAYDELKSDTVVVRHRSMQVAVEKAVA